MRISDWSSDVCSSDLTPVISPAGLVIYSGDLFPAWKGSALIGGLSSEALVRVAIDGESAREAERFEMGRRIREVEQGPHGAVWLLEDDDGRRPLKLTPSQLHLQLNPR